MNGMTRNILVIGGLIVLSSVIYMAIQYFDSIEGIVISRYRSIIRN